MKQIIKAELYYLVKSKSLWVYLGIFALCTAVNVIMSNDPKLGISLFVITTLLVSKLMHKDKDKTTLKNIAGCGVTYSQIFRAKCLVALIVCGSMLFVSSAASAICNLCRAPAEFNASAALIDFLAKLANYLIILIVGEFTGSVGGTIVLSILITGVLPFVISLVRAGDNFIARLCNAVYPYILDGFSSDPLTTAIPKYLLVLAVVAVLLVLSEKHYVGKHYI